MILDEMLEDADFTVRFILENADGDWVDRYDGDIEEILTCEVRYALIHLLLEEMHIMLSHWKKIRSRVDNQDELEFSEELIKQVEDLIQEFNSNLNQNNRTEDDW
jgi:hypothetical protein